MTDNVMVTLTTLLLALFMTMIYMSDQHFIDAYLMFACRICDRTVQECFRCVSVLESI